MTPFRDLFDFTGRRVLVTGAANGIGEAIARAFVALGAHAILADRDEASLRKVAAELAGSCTPQLFEQGDMSSLEKLAASSGDVDILVNNAGIAVRGPLLELDPVDLRRVVDVNLVGPIALTRWVGGAMVRRGRGTIINISSQMAFIGARNRSVYASTKSAIVQFTRTSALEWGPHGVRVNCIAPGRTITAINRDLWNDPVEYESALQRIPLRRYGQPDDIANAALFLASQAAAYITGQTIVVDGGWILEG
ncbi:MAG TPA: SDR family NAD(P)-dependent oxidoreductase [Casimicrobiaceae bacterium]|nr:SDR family NAD(P)-dependent oxidoreductase [Casimicrobiaceae bacterium]